MQTDLKQKCSSAAHKQLKSNAMSNVDKLQGLILNLQHARREGQNVYVIEEQMNQVLKDWQTELNQTSSASSIHGSDSNLVLDSADINRLMLSSDEQDDATSPLDESKAQKYTNHRQTVQEADISRILNNPRESYIPQIERGFEGFNYASSNLFDTSENDLQTNWQVQYGQFDWSLGADNVLNVSSSGLDQNFVDILDFDFPSVPVTPPPAAFLGPKCALWDCARPAAFDKDYCYDIHHAALAQNEGEVGKGPVVRPKGISFKDSVLFDALKAKIHGKEVGIPECDGAVSARAPWNAPKLFDMSLLEGETIREWLFFDKPRKAFEVGNRKQRSLPDYNGRGWHESRKQVMKEFGGLKRSYYMDPQPVSHLEWHLFEYGVDKCDSQALYRLELKLVDGKKKLKGKIVKDPLADLQTRMGRLTAVSTENKFSPASMSETSESVNGNTPAAPNQVPSTTASVENGTGGTYDEDEVDILTEYKRMNSTAS